jgi:hypothetical protein
VANGEQKAYQANIVRTLMFCILLGVLRDGLLRSLIALSLIMSLLQVKPAPMYILDEVDAALDLSHTQNIGQLFRTRFRGSQFIVISLKSGLFDNVRQFSHSFFFFHRSLFPNGWQSFRQTFFSGLGSVTGRRSSSGQCPGVTASCTRRRTRVLAELEERRVVALLVVEQCRQRAH